jgi:tetratricopeptide (TPR) repeat protein
MRWAKALTVAGVGLALCVPARASSTGDLQVIAAAIRAGRLIQAEVMLARLPVPTKPDDAEAIADVRGQFALATGASEQALRIFETLRTAQPGRCEYLRDFGVAAARTGDARALDALRDAVPRCANWQSGQVLGVVLAQMRRWDESEGAFALSLRLFPGNAVTLNNRAFARIEQGRYDDALDDLRAALRAAPGDRRVTNNIDLVEGARGNTPRRRQGVDDDRAWASRLTLAAKGALRAGRIDLARAMLAQAVDVSPYHAREPTALLAGLAEARGGAQ